MNSEHLDEQFEDVYLNGYLRPATLEISMNPDKITGDLSPIPMCGIFQALISWACRAMLPQSSLKPYSLTPSRSYVANSEGSHRPGAVTLLLKLRKKMEANPQVPRVAEDKEQVMTRTHT